MWHVFSSPLGLVVPLSFLNVVFAQSSTISSPVVSPSIAPGFLSCLVATGLTAPRGIKFDNNGTLLVVEQGVGVTALTLGSINAAANCTKEVSRQMVIDDSTLNHGIEMSPDGETLYASSSEAVYSWAYDSTTTSNTSAPTVLVTNMTGTDHTTRTLLLSKKEPDLLLVSRGSISNVDLEAEMISSGHSQVKAFNLTNATSTYQFDTDGLLLGWGLRNDVGVDEDPVMGGIWTVENSVDDMTRDGQDIHQNNPGEELNFLGYLNGTHYDEQGANFGYPECFAAWEVASIPNNSAIQVGTQFGIQLQNGTENVTISDSYCATTAAPRLTFQAHMAPLDILFNPAGTAAWVTFHGSWDRTDPVGYKLSVLEFADGSPTEPSTSTTALRDVFSNGNLTACPGECFRPVGLAWDSAGRLFMSSDSTGEIYMIVRADGNSTSNAGSTEPSSLPSPSVSASASSTGSSPAATTSKSTGIQMASAVSLNALWVLCGLFAFIV